MPNQNARGLKSNIFARYFVLFAAIFLITLTVLGISLTTLVSAYSRNEKTELLSENTKTMATAVAGVLDVDQMNSNYSVQKELICESLGVISHTIDADVFVCDVEGNVILCKDRVGKFINPNNFKHCPIHDKYSIDSKLLQSVYEGGNVSKTIINGKECYIVGTAIVDDDVIIGSVFAVTESKTSALVLAVVKIFLICALICLGIAFVCIWFLTKKMLTPLQQMSVAAKKFAVGDFSYRVNVTGSDELSDLGNAFNDMADALDKLESSRRSFVANVSHELKTPMTSIAGFIDGILDGTIPKEKQEYYLKIVSDEVRRLSRLVVAMLNMSKIESGDFVMKPKVYNFTDQIIHILLTFEQKIEKKHIEIQGLEDIKQVDIQADPDMIYQVVYNLFDNSVKFTNESGYINVGIVEYDTYVQLTIKNSGSGIKSQELSKIFERFYKVDKSRSLDSKGAGLGLYIVKMMVEMHGGRIYAKSDSETEAEFIVTLPKKQPNKN